jgi:hypothetical protein
VGVAGCLSEAAAGDEGSAGVGPGVEGCESEEGCFAPRLRDAKPAAMQHCSSMDGVKWAYWLG